MSAVTIALIATILASFVQASYPGCPFEITNTAKDIVVDCFKNCTTIYCTQSMKYFIPEFGDKLFGLPINQCDSFGNQYCLYDILCDPSSIYNTKILIVDPSLDTNELYNEKISGSPSDNEAIASLSESNDNMKTSETEDSQTTTSESSSETNPDNIPDSSLSNNKTEKHESNRKTDEDKDTKTEELDLGDNNDDLTTASSTPEVSKSTDETNPDNVENTSTVSQEETESSNDDIITGPNWSMFDVIFPNAQDEEKGSIMSINEMNTGSSDNTLQSFDLAAQNEATNPDNVENTSTVPQEETESSNEDINTGPNWSMFNVNFPNALDEATGSIMSIHEMNTDSSDSTLQSFDSTAQNEETNPDNVENTSTVPQEETESSNEDITIGSNWIMFNAQDKAKGSTSINEINTDSVDNTLQSSDLATQNKDITNPAIFRDDTQSDTPGLNGQTTLETDDAKSVTKSTDYNDKALSDFTTPETMDAKIEKLMKDISDTIISMEALMKNVKKVDESASSSFLSEEAKPDNVQNFAEVDEISPVTSPGETDPDGESNSADLASISSSTSYAEANPNSELNFAAELVYTPLSTIYDENTNVPTEKSIDTSESINNDARNNKESWKSATLADLLEEETPSYQQDNSNDKSSFKIEPTDDSLNDEQVYKCESSVSKTDGETISADTPDTQNHDIDSKCDYECSIDLVHFLKTLCKGINEIDEEISICKKNEIMNMKFNDLIEKLKNNPPVSTDNQEENLPTSGATVDTVASDALTSEVSENRDSSANDSREAELSTEASTPASDTDAPKSDAESPKADPLYMKTESPVYETPEISDVSQKVELSKGIYAPTVASDAPTSEVSENRDSSANDSTEAELSTEPSTPASDTDAPKSNAESPKAHHLYLITEPPAYETPEISDVSQKVDFSKALYTPSVASDAPTSEFSESPEFLANDLTEAELSTEPSTPASDTDAPKSDAESSKADHLYMITESPVYKTPEISDVSQKVEFSKALYTPTVASDAPTSEFSENPESSANDSTEAELPTESSTPASDTDEPKSDAVSPKADHLYMKTESSGYETPEISDVSQKVELLKPLYTPNYLYNKAKMSSISDSIFDSKTFVPSVTENDISFNSEPSSLPNDLESKGFTSSSNKPLFTSSSQAQLDTKYNVKVNGKELSQTSLDNFKDTSSTTSAVNNELCFPTPLPFYDNCFPPERVVFPPVPTYDIFNPTLPCAEPCYVPFKQPLTPLPPYSECCIPPISNYPINLNGEFIPNAPYTSITPFVPPIHEYPLAISRCPLPIHAPPSLLSHLPNNFPLPSDNCFPPLPDGFPLPADSFIPPDYRFDVFRQPPFDNNRFIQPEPCLFPPPVSSETFEHPFAYDIPYSPLPDISPLPINFPPRQKIETFAPPFPPAIPPIQNGQCPCY